KKLSPTEQQVIVRQILPESLGDLMVTPKEIDRLMDDISKIIASAINEVLHPVINEENISQYLKF
uniref:GPR endopeptidase n=1 Tax=Selenobaculum sp. TaxID=3074374 RepID=UPI003AB26C6B